MKKRCANKTDQGYRNYGGRGIAVCERWLGVNGFENFLADMGEPPVGMSLGRIDNNGNYDPSNCRWETPTQQSNNTRVNHVMTFQGQSLTMMEWSRVTGIKFSTLKQRLWRGWTVADTLTKGVRHAAS